MWRPRKEREERWRRRVRRDRRRGERRTFVCTICERTVPFAWSCPCGFMICDECFAENAWGMTCNYVTWQCPDCGAWRSF